MDSIKFKDLNKIPVRTGRKTKVNEISVKYETPKIKDFKTMVIKGYEQEGLSVEYLHREKFENLKGFRYGVGTELIEEAEKNYNNGTLIRVKEGIKLEEPIVIDFEMDEVNNTLIDNILVEAEKDSKVSVIVRYKSVDDSEGYHNGVARVFAKENAQVKLTKVNLFNNKVKTFDSNQSDIKENANVHFVAVELGGEITVSNYEGDLVGDSSKGELSAVYIGADKETIDLNYVMTARAKKTENEMNIKGALKDHAVKNFKGTIDFKRGATRSTGAEEEYCLLLSERARSRSVPLLLCEEDDVSGEHAAASGRLDENKLFYLMSRGLSYDEAKILIIKAEFNPIVDEIENETIKEEVLAYIEERLVNGK